MLTIIESSDADSSFSVIVMFAISETNYVPGKNLSEFGKGQVRKLVQRVWMQGLRRMHADILAGRPTILCRFELLASV